MLSFLFPFGSDNVFYCYVFKMASKEKAFALALSITKAFYLACQILQEEQGLFPATPERDTLFEPQHDDDTKVVVERGLLEGKGGTCLVIK